MYGPPIVVNRRPSTITLCDTASFVAAQVMVTELPDVIVLGDTTTEETTGGVTGPGATVKVPV